MTYEPKTLTCQAVLFDMDGTLVNSLHVVEEVWGEFADRFGLDVTEVLAFCHGRPARESIAHFAPEGADRDGILQELESAELTRTDGIVEIPGARQLIKQLQHGRVALVTSAPADLATMRMDAAGIPMPVVMVSASDVDLGKPNPAPYLEAARQLGIAPSDCVIFEDAEAGIRAGIASGGQVVVVGEHQSEVTEPLPQVRDLVGVTASVADDGTITLVLGQA